ncbi:GTPase [Candidatus Riflebacteria bacterium]
MSKNEGEKFREDLIQLLKEVVEKLQPLGMDEIRRQLSDLLEIITGGRAPRIMLIGRSGSGKSSLINSLFGKYVAPIGTVRPESEGRWYSYQDQEKNRTLDVLDTRGNEESIKATEGEAATPFEALKLLLRNKIPDVCVYLVAAKNVRNYVDLDVDYLKDVREHIQAGETGYQLPIIPVVNKVDALDPIKADLHNEEKSRHIKDCLDYLTKAMNSKGLTFPNPIPICTRLDFKKKKDQSGNWEVIKPNEIKYDSRWNIALIIDEMQENLPNEAKMAMAGITDMAEVQRKLANKIITMCRNLCITAAGTPIPILKDVLIITPVQVIMVCMVAYISGRQINTKTIGEFFMGLGLTGGSAILARKLAGELGALIPGAGLWVRMGIAAGTTEALGKAAVSYFIDKEDMKNVKEKFEESKDKNLATTE